jgi:hypothetical protein
VSHTKGSVWTFPLFSSAFCPTFSQETVSFITHYFTNRHALELSLAFLVKSKAHTKNDLCFVLSDKKF